MLEYKSFIAPISHIISDNFNFYPSYLKDILKQWAENKNSLYQLFGKQLIITGDTIEISVQNEDAITDDFSKFKFGLYSFFKDDISRELFKDFLYDAVGLQGFAQNKVTRTWTGYINKTFTITEGMKFAKAFKFFFDEEEQTQLINLQNFYSTFAQQFKSKRKGKICLSIHPYDYLTSSVNNNRWGSCHNLVDGDYKAGNFNYMVDSSTIVAYYIAEDDYNNKKLIDLNNFEWNSKYWRMFIHIKHDENKIIIVYNRQYPGDSQQLLEEVNKLLLPIYQKFYTLKETTISLATFTELAIKPFEYPDNICFYDDLHEGNDIRFRISTDTKLEEYTKFIQIGESFNCLSCGTEEANSGEFGCCESCTWERSRTTCADCGEIIHPDEIYYIETEDVEVCYDCYHRLYKTCEVCQETFLSTKLRLIPSIGTVCIDCENEISNTKPKDKFFILK